MEMGEIMETRRIWLRGGLDIFLPLFVYLLGSWGIELLYRALLPAELFAAHEAAFQGLENLLLLPVLYGMFYGLPGRERQKRSTCGGRWDSLWVIGSSFCLSRGINHFLGLILLPWRFPGYEEATASIFREPFWIQVAVVVVAAPLLEELLMRGIVYQRMRVWSEDRKKAALGSSLLFALFHGSLVQALYAFFLGIFFAWLLEKFHGLWAPVLAHATANGAAVLANWFTLSGLSMPGGYPVWEYFRTGALLLAAYGIMQKMKGGRKDVRDH